MPGMQTAMGPLNQRFGPGNVSDRELNPPDAFAEGVRLSALVEDEQYVPMEAAIAFLDSMPEAMHEAIRAVIRSNLQRAEPLPITFAWQPGYDWELTLNDISNTNKTKGGITMIVRSRYPDDPHPLEQTAS